MPFKVANLFFSPAREGISYVRKSAAIHKRATCLLISATQSDVMGPYPMLSHWQMDHSLQHRPQQPREGISHMWDSLWLYTSVPLAFSCLQAQSESSEALVMAFVVDRDWSTPPTRCVQAPESIPIISSHQPRAAQLTELLGHIKETSSITFIVANTCTTLRCLGPFKGSGKPFDGAEQHFSLSDTKLSLVIRSCLLVVDD